MEKARGRARARVAALRAEYPREDRFGLGQRLVRSSANKAGMWGAATSTVALITLPVGLPAGIAASLYCEAELILALLHLYELDAEGDEGRVRLYALWAGAGFADAAKSVGLRTGARALGKILSESLPGQLIRRLNPVLLRAILKRLGLGWLPKAMKLWPIIGAPIGFVIDRAALRTLGDATLATLDDVARAKTKAAPKATTEERAARRRTRVVLKKVSSSGT